MKIQYFITVLVILALKTHAHEKPATATYLGNEGVMVQNADSKILFDPFFHNGFNTYQLVSEQTRQTIFSGRTPYDDIDAVFISHAHGDHFSAEDLLKYLKNNPEVDLIAPTQAIERISALDNSDSVKSQMTSISLKKGDQAQTLTIDNLLIEVVRIPHAGWPSRADVSNLVFRVTLSDDVTIMHMGDADPDDEHFLPYKEHWMKNKTNTAFPPYWFFISKEGDIILDKHINAEKSIGIHVPIKVPELLIKSKKPYFSKPGQQESLNHKHN